MSHESAKSFNRSPTHEQVSCYDIMDIMDIISISHQKCIKMCSAQKKELHTIVIIIENFLRLSFIARLRLLSWNQQNFFFAYIYCCCHDIQHTTKQLWSLMMSQSTPFMSIFFIIVLRKDEKYYRLCNFFAAPFCYWTRFSQINYILK